MKYAREQVILAQVIVNVRQRKEGSKAELRRKCVREVVGLSSIGNTDRS